MRRNRILPQAVVCEQFAKLSTLSILHIRDSYRIGMRTARKLKLIVLVVIETLKAKRGNKKMKVQTSQCHKKFVINTSCHVHSQTLSNSFSLRRFISQSILYCKANFKGSIPREVLERKM